MKNKRNALRTVMRPHANSQCFQRPAKFSLRESHAYNDREQVTTRNLPDNCDCGSISRRRRVGRSETSASASLRYLFRRDCMYIYICTHAYAYMCLWTVCRMHIMLHTNSANPIAACRGSDLPAARSDGLARRCDLFLLLLLFLLLFPLV